MELLPDEAQQNARGGGGGGGAVPAPPQTPPASPQRPHGSPAKSGTTVATPTHDCRLQTGSESIPPIPAMTSGARVGSARCHKSTSRTRSATTSATLIHTPNSCEVFRGQFRRTSPGHRRRGRVGEEAQEEAPVAWGRGGGGTRF